jgi:hypothetical protein
MMNFFGRNIVPGISVFVFHHFPIDLDLAGRDVVALPQHTLFLSHLVALVSLSFAFALRFIPRGRPGCFGRSLSQPKA